MKRILITGAVGQIGSELTVALRDRYGAEHVVASDIRVSENPALEDGGPFVILDVLSTEQIARVMQEFRIDTVYHLGAILSATGEANPAKAWRVNMDGLYHMLEAALEFGSAVFFPSSIGAFGPSTPQDNTPQDTIMRPQTMYGVTKLAGELLCDYYFKRFGIDTRGLRFPGLISYETEPGGGTTDYAVAIFFEAVKHKRYTCYLKPDTSLDMMYMPDAIRAMIELMEADPRRLVHRNAFNVTAMSFTPAKLAAEIRRRIPDFVMEYSIDPVRQAIADSWPNSMDDSAARKEWGWAPEYDLPRMVSVMLEAVSQKVHQAAGAGR